MRSAPEETAPWPEAETAAPAPPRAARRVMALAEVFLCSGLPTQVVMLQLLAAAGLQAFRTDGQLSPTYVFALSIGDAFLLIAVIVGFLMLHGERPRDVFLGPRSPGWEAALGVLLTPLVFVLALGMLVLIQNVAPWMHNVEKNPLEDLIGTPGDAAVFVVVAIVAGGLREEMQRAFILHRFEQHLGGALLGLALFSLAFGAGHLIQGYDAALTTGLLGAFWGGVYLIRRSILAPAVSHAAFNVAEILNHVFFRV